MFQISLITVTSSLGCLRDKLLTWCVLLHLSLMLGNFDVMTQIFFRFYCQTILNSVLRRRKIRLKSWVTALLLCPQQWWRSIVMNTSVCISVCLCVCLSASISPEQHAPSLSPWLGPPPTGWCNRKWKGQFWGFSSQLKMQCMGHIAVWISLGRTSLA